jgi:SUN domain-containing protein 1/2
LLQFLLSPPVQLGACLPLLGTSGWVDVRLARRIRPSSVTYEHVPAAIAHDIRSAPRTLSLLGFLGPPPRPSPADDGNGAGLGSGAAAQGVPLGSFIYDALAKNPVQTFQLSAEAREAEVDHVRLEVRDNHGQPGFTCLYRLRVHGTPL